MVGGMAIFNQPRHEQHRKVVILIEEQPGISTRILAGQHGVSQSATQ